MKRMEREMKPKRKKEEERTKDDYLCIKISNVDNNGQ